MSNSIISFKLIFILGISTSLHFCTSSSLNKLPIKENIFQQTSWLASIFSRNESGNGWVFERTGALVSAQKVLFGGKFNFSKPLREYRIVVGLEEYILGQDFPTNDQVQIHKINFIAYPWRVNGSFNYALAYLETPLSVDMGFKNIEIDFYSKSFYYWTHIENNTVPGHVNLLSMDILDDISDKEWLVAGFSRNGSKLTLEIFQEDEEEENEQRDMCLENGNIFIFKVDPNVTQSFLLFIVPSEETETDSRFCTRKNEKAVETFERWVIFKPTQEIHLFFWDAYKCTERFPCTGGNNVQNRCLSKDLICDGRNDCGGKTLGESLEEGPEYCSQEIGDPDENKSVLESAYFYVIIVTLGVSIILVTLVRFKLQSKKIPDDVIRAFLKGNEMRENDLLMTSPYDSRYEIDPAHLLKDNGKILGSGSNGMVFEGKLLDLQSGSRKVAIKTLNPEADIGYIKGMLREIKTLIYLGDFEYIVKFYGAITEKIHQGDISIVVEYCGNGSLDRFLRDNRWDSDQGSQPTSNGYIASTQTEKFMITPRLMMRWALEIASGMEYLERKRVVHADLASRNLLLSDNYTAKISDFGLSRKLYSNLNYIVNKEELLPWRFGIFKKSLESFFKKIPKRWMSIEALRDLDISSSSDVWAFSVVLWEIFTFAQLPFEAIHFSPDFISKLEKGLRPEFPSHTPEAIVYLGNLCWSRDKNERPTFRDIAQFLQGANEALMVENEDYSRL